MNAKSIREWYANAPKVRRPCWCGWHTGNVYAHEDRHGVPLELIVCGRCSTVRVANYLSDEAIDDLYRTKYRALFDNDGPAAIYDAQLKNGVAMRKALGITSAECVIDFGSGAGGLLDAFPDARAIGIEPGEYARYGQARGSKAEIATHASPAFDGCADYVFAIHTLEHRVDLVVALAMHAALLKPDGRLVVEFPSLAVYERSYETLSRYLQAPHYWQFTEATLVDAARRSGLTATRRGRPEGVVEFCLSTNVDSESDHLLKTGGATERGSV